jgi:feruloyl esterase
MAIEYYNSVAKTMGGTGQTKDFFRLFMVPDFGMCAGMFPGTFDALGAVQRWREEGIAPDKIIASYNNSGKIYKKRPVCSYPQTAIYKGSGDSNDPDNFRCGAPKW